MPVLVPFLSFLTLQSQDETAQAIHRIQLQSELCPILPSQGHHSFTMPYHSWQRTLFVPSQPKEALDTRSNTLGMGFKTPRNQQMWFQVCDLTNRFPGSFLNTTVWSPPELQWPYNCKCVEPSMHLFPRHILDPFTLRRKGCLPLSEEDQALVLVILRNMVKNHIIFDFFLYDKLSTLKTILHIFHVCGTVFLSASAWAGNSVSLLAITRTKLC